MKQFKHNEVWKSILFKIIPEMQGTYLSGGNRIWIPVDHKDEPTSRRWSNITRKPKYIQYGTLNYNTLKWIWQGGSAGRRYRDIQLFLIGGEERVKQGTQFRKEQVWNWRTESWSMANVNPKRGQYSGWLSYTMPNFCIRGSDGRWRLNDQALIAHFNQLTSTTQ